MSLKNPLTYLLEKSSTFLLSLLVSFVLIFGIVCVLAYESYQDAIHSTILSNRTRASLIAKIILEHQRAAIGVVRSYANRPLLMESVKKRNYEEALPHLTSLVENNPEIEMAFITDPGGILWGNYPIFEEAFNQDLSYRDWYKGVSKEWAPYVSNVYKLMVGEKELAVSVCSPVHDAKRKVIGILSATQTTLFFKKIVSEMGLDLDSKITLIDQNRHIIFSNRFPYIKEVTDYPAFEFVEKAMKGEKDDVEMIDSSDGDRAKYVSFAPVQGIGWSVIVEKTRRDVLRSVFPDFSRLAIVSVLIFTVVVLSLAYLRGRQKQIMVLRESESRLRMLTSQLLSAQEQERKRVAGELHDSIGSSLNAIKFKIDDTLHKTKEGLVTTKTLEDLRSITQQAMEECRRTQANLRPSMLDDLGVLPTLEWHCREFQKIYPHISIDKQVAISEDEVSDSLKTVIYRVTQEALNNIAKHGKADLVGLRLQKANGLIELTIRDNGQGFDLEEVFSGKSHGRGMGLSSMRERTELLRGTFSIESTIGKGTVIQVSWPIER